MAFLRHVGKMKNNGAKIAVAYRTLPGDSGSALVIGTSNLPYGWHDSLMGLLQDPSGQQANELADILAVRKFPDGVNMLEGLHRDGHLKKVATSAVLMTPTNSDSILLSELNALLAQEKGVNIDELAISDGSQLPKGKAKKTDTAEPVVEDLTRTTSASVNASAEASVVEETVDLSPAQLRSKADALFKQAQTLRKQADSIDPPKSKKKQVVSDEV